MVLLKLSNDFNVKLRDLIEARNYKFFCTIFQILSTFTTISMAVVKQRTHFINLRDIVTLCASSNLERVICEILTPLFLAASAMKYSSAEK